MDALSLQDQSTPTNRSYIPPHMRSKMQGGGQSTPPPMNGSPAAGPPIPQAINGLNNSAWAG
jgi:ATP-dependent RNA helicase DDX3X